MDVALDHGGIGSQLAITRHPLLACLADVELLGFARGELQAALRAHPEAGVQVLTNLGMVVVRRLQVMQALWARELQRSVNETHATSRPE